MDCSPLGSSVHGILHATLYDRVVFEDYGRIPPLTFEISFLKRPPSQRQTNIISISLAKSTNLGGKNGISGRVLRNVQTEYHLGYTSKKLYKTLKLHY